MAKQKYWDGSKFVQVSPSMDEFESNSVFYSDDTGTANAKVLTLTTTLASGLKKGLAVSFANKTLNTAAVTINVNALGAKALVNQSGDVLTAGDLKANIVYTARYNGTSFILQGEGGGKLIIPGQEIVPIKLTTNVNAFDAVAGASEFLTNSKLPDFAVAPTGSITGMDYSPNGTFLAVTHGDTPFITIYKVSGNTFTKLPNPASLPGAYASDLRFSPDGKFLAVVMNNFPYLAIYKIAGDVFTKLANPAKMPPFITTGLDFSPDSKFLAIAHADVPYNLLYTISGDVFTQLVIPAPAGNSVKTSFSPDGKFLAFSLTSSPFVHVLKKVGSVFTKLPNLPDLNPTAQGYGISFSPNSKLLTFGHSGSGPQYFITYGIVGEVFTRLADPDIPPSNTAMDVKYSPNGRFMITQGSNASPFNLYEISMDSFKKSDLPVIMPTGPSTSAAFSPDSEFLTLGMQNSPYLHTYKISNNIQKLDPPLTIEKNLLWYGYASKKGNIGETIDIIKLWRV